jgi:hypothetical protein
MPFIYDRETMNKNVLLEAVQASGHSDLHSTAIYTYHDGELELGNVYPTASAGTACGGPILAARFPQFMACLAKQLSRKRALADAGAVRLRREGEARVRSALIRAFKQSRRKNAKTLSSYLDDSAHCVDALRGYA